MPDQPIRFEDGAAYDRGMGAWSRVAGDTFLEWIAPPPGLKWLDVGCGSGAFTDLLVRRCAPAEMRGVDPSEHQLLFARARPSVINVEFQQGDAMALPFADNSSDAAVMALVIFFVPDPAKGVAEMARVVRSGGIVAAYAWDMAGGGFPFHPIQAELRAMGVTSPLPPSPDASRTEVLHALWTAAGLQAIESRVIAARRTFDDFEDFWRQSTGMGSIRPTIAAMTPAEVAQFKDRVRARLRTGDHGRITHEARANAIKGRVG